MPNIKESQLGRASIFQADASGPTDLAQRMLSALASHSLAGVKDCCAESGDRKLAEEHEATHNALSEAVFAIRKAFRENPTKHLVDMAMASLVMEHDRDEYPDDGNIVTHKRKIDRAVMHSILKAAGVDPSLCCRELAWERAEQLLEVDQIVAAPWAFSAAH